ncbi:MAG TPA: alternative ribosome rescue aminoacyl-tRNA hydrolase ArfB [Mycobacteriales bacterium]
MPADLPVNSRVTIPGEELTERFSRSSGPGGQGVNTTDSRVELVWDLSESDLPEDVLDKLRRRLGSRLAGDAVTVVASERRSQLRNREAARERLAALVGRALEPPPPPRRATRPSRGATERRIAAKKRRSATKRTRRGDSYD